MNAVKKPTWQQATALLSLSTCGAMTGFAYAHGSVDDMTSPSRIPVHLLALKKPGTPASANDSALRTAIVNAASYYLRMAQTKSPAQMEAIIWQGDSIDGVDHGESCAAFASLTLELGAQATGQQSWVTGGTSYPWPLHAWADVRVDPNPGSLNIISVLQDAQAHQRWHPLGDGYQPQPGDWVLFDGHVEVVTKFAGGVLYTIGGDSGADLSVNAHQYSAPLVAQGVEGFVNNGDLQSASGEPVPVAAGQTASADGQAQAQESPGQAAIPGIEAVALIEANDGQAASNNGAATKGTAGTVGTAGKATAAGRATRSGAARRSASGGGRPAAAGPGATGTLSMPGAMAGAGTIASAGTAPAQPGRAGTAVIPGVQTITDDLAASAQAPARPSYTRNNGPAASAQVPGTTSQQAFISQVAPGAVAAEARYGVPASVTIAQAIEESGWGQSVLAIRDYNLFGIKGTGPAGTDMLPTQEYLNGQWITETQPFRVYHNVAESIADHGELLATSGYYQQAMADRHVPDAFANDLTGVYATDPNYGANLIAIMRLYNLYQYDVPAGTGPQLPAQASAAGRGATAGSGGVLSPGGLLSTGGIVNEGGTVGAATAPDAGGPSSRATAGHQGSTAIPGVLDAYLTTPVRTPPTQASRAAASRAAASRATASRAASLNRVPGNGVPRDTASALRRAAQPGRAAAPRVAPRGTRSGPSASRYVPQMPRSVTTAFLAAAKTPLSRAQPLYADVASRSGIRWELLAACDWMQCKAQPRYSPVHGEKLGTVNASGTAYRTKSEALAQCASDLVELAMAVYWLDITARRRLSVRDLAKVFAAFRWGGLLKLHDISAMEFPYSVEGLTAQHVKMRWPDIKEPNAPDRPGARFRMPFGAVPVVLSLGYPAVA